MRRDDIKTELQKIFRVLFARDSIELRDEMTAKDVPGWDSISHISLVVSVEQRFGIMLTIKDVSGLGNVGQLVDLIASKRG